MTSEEQKNNAIYRKAKAIEQYVCNPLDNKY